MTVTVAITGTGSPFSKRWRILPLPYGTDSLVIQKRMTSQHAQLGHVAFFIHRDLEDDHTRDTRSLRELWIYGFDFLDELGFLNISAHANRFTFDRARRRRRRRRRRHSTEHSPDYASGYATDHSTLNATRNASDDSAYAHNGRLIDRRRNFLRNFRRGDELRRVDGHPLRHHLRRSRRRRRRRWRRRRWRRRDQKRQQLAFRKHIEEDQAGL